MATQSEQLLQQKLEHYQNVVQAHDEGYVRVLPPVGRTVKVAFYSGSCDSLAHSRPLLQAMLGVCSKPRAGTYRYCAAHVNACFSLKCPAYKPLCTTAMEYPGRCAQ